MKKKLEDYTLVDKPRLGKSSEEGTQPIRVLNFWIREYFSREETRFQDLKAIARAQGVENIPDEELEITFIFEETKVQETGGVMYNNIILHESFLSFLWCFCFSSIVDFNENVCKPRLDREVNERLKQLGVEVGNYGMSLLCDFIEWDITIPNPEYYCKEFSHDIILVSEAYLDAIWFINMHEFAHIIYEHTSYSAEGEPKNSEQLRMDEIIADQFALRYCKIFLDETPPNRREDRLIGFIVGLLALMMSKEELNTDNYPHIHVRAIAALRTLSWDDTNLAWGICASVFKNWAITYGYDDLQVRTHYESDKHYCLHLGSVIQTTIKEEEYQE